MPRKKTPADREATILYRERHTCCVCHDRYKDVAIHHIDGNNQNDAEDNLCVVCLDCHSRVTGRRGLGKAFSAKEVGLYKQQWEDMVQAEAKSLSRARAKPSTGQIRYLMLAQVKMTVYRILAMPDSNAKLLEERFEELWNLANFENLTSETMSELSDVLAMTAAYQVNKPAILAKSLPSYFTHLIYTDDAAMNRKEERNVLAAIHILEYLHNFADERRPYKLLSVVRSSLLEFALIGIRYRRRSVFRLAARVLRALLKTAKGVDGKKKMPRLVSEIGSARSALRGNLTASRLRWQV